MAGAIADGINRIPHALVGKWGDGKRECGDGRREAGDGRRETGGGRRVKSSPSRGGQAKRIPRWRGWREAPGVDQQTNK
jgi:hypothetical protein